MSTHSPTPWRFDEMECDIIDADGETVGHTLVFEAETDYEQVSFADGHLIVRAVNAHDELVAALKGLLREEWATYEGNLEASGHASVDDLEFARAVLAKVMP